VQHAAGSCRADGVSGAGQAREHPLDPIKTRDKIVEASVDSILVALLLLGVRLIALAGVSSGGRCVRSADRGGAGSDLSVTTE
jgi:hypothetical protein